MKTYQTIKISLICLFFGLLFCAYQQGWIIFRRPTLSTGEFTAEPVATKKTAKLTYWHADAWHAEKTQLIWPAQPAQALEYLITSWLSLLDEEGNNPQKTAVQSVIIAPSGQEAFVSFDKSPFETQQTMYEKWMWLEGLLATIRENMEEVQAIRLLVRHKPLNDPHLDFSNSWPVRGFLT